MKDLILKADNLYFSYEGDKNHSLNGLSLDIEEREKDCLYGAEWFRQIHFFSLLQRYTEACFRQPLFGRGTL